MRIVLILWVIWTGAAMAQTPSLAPSQAPSLIADRLVVEGRTLTASGNVTAFFEGATLQARTVRYDGQADRLSVTGPIVLTTADGAVLTGDQADISPQLQQGLLTGARLVLDRRLQLTSAQIDHRAGQYSRLARTRATSCAVCAGKTPLWEIRATSVIHDLKDRQLWFDGAQVRIKGVPVAYVPRLRLPDPSVSRARGLLLPQITSSNVTGPGLRLPWFLPLGDHRDLTLTPVIARKTQGTELRYRQAFAAGDLTVTGGAMRDDRWRGWLLGDLALRLPRQWQLTADLEIASDDTVLDDYNVTRKTRRDSRLSLTRITATSLSEARLTGYHSQRPGESNLTEPTLLAFTRTERRLPLAGGRLRFGLSADAHMRRASGPDGRDAARLSAFARWDHRMQAAGLVLDTSAAASTGLHWSAQDPAVPDQLTRSQGAATLTLSYPLIRPGATTHTLTPHITVGWSGDWSGNPARPKNEDSTRPAFDLTSLTALSRFPGEDGPAEGRFASLGGTWTMQHDRLAARLSFGRLFRIEPAKFAPSTGLNGRRSAWVIAGDLTLGDNTSLMTRAVTGDALLRAETRLSWAQDGLDLSATHVFLAADPDQNRSKRISDLTLDSDWQVTDAWAIATRASYDIAEGRAKSARVGLTWRNECARLGLSVSHRFDGAANNGSNTSFGLDVAIEGFSASTRRPTARSCTE